MKRSRFTGTQIVKTLKEIEGGRLVKEVCREHGISDATYYNRKTKYGDMDTFDVEWLKDFQPKNSESDSFHAKLL